MNVKLYQTEDGTEPVTEFLQSLDRPMHAKAMQAINLLQARGHLLRPPYSKELNDGIMELRISAGNNISQILYFFVIGNTAILTNGFIKKTMSMPPVEIERAKQYRQDYMRRNPK